MSTEPKRRGPRPGPRIRTIKPEIHKDEELGACSDSAFRLFVGLMTLADDEGRQKANPALLAAEIWPYREDMNAAAVTVLLGELEAAGLVQSYTVEGKQYCYLPGWEDHQRIDHPTASKCPAPTAENTVFAGSSETLGNSRESSENVCAGPGPGPLPGTPAAAARASASKPDASRSQQALAEFGLPWTEEQHTLGLVLAEGLSVRERRPQVRVDDASTLRVMLANDGADHVKVARLAAADLVSGRAKSEFFHVRLQMKYDDDRDHLTGRRRAGYVHASANTERQERSDKDAAAWASFGGGDLQ